MSDWQWINKTASDYGVGGDPNIAKMMGVAIDYERNRCAKIAEAIDSGRGNEKQIAAAIRRGM